MISSMLPSIPLSMLIVILPIDWSNGPVSTFYVQQPRGSPVGPGAMASRMSVAREKNTAKNLTRIPMQRPARKVQVYLPGAKLLLVLDNVNDMGLRVHPLLCASPSFMRRASMHMHFILIRISRSNARSYHLGQSVKQQLPCSKTKSKQAQPAELIYIHPLINGLNLLRTSN